MDNPFPHADGPFPGGPGAQGFGFHPQARRALHEQRRQARREFRDFVRGHDAGHDGPLARVSVPVSVRASAGVSVPADSASAPARAVGGAADAGRRGRRGDVRAAILVLLAERPMHGYEMIQEIAERSQDLWRPSPGSVYPTLQLLVDEGLIVGTETEGSKKLFELTDAGKAAAEKVETPPWDEIAEGVDPAHLNLRAAVGQLFGAVAQSAHAASTEQQQRIIDIVNNARREIYTILGEDD